MNVKIKILVLVLILGLCSAINFIPKLRASLSPPGCCACCKDCGEETLYWSSTVLNRCKNSQGQYVPCYVVTCGVGWEGGGA
jgi:hypothetical protein